MSVELIEQLAVEAEIDLKRATHRFCFLSQALSETKEQGTSDAQIVYVGEQNLLRCEKCQ